MLHTAKFDGQTYWIKYILKFFASAKIQTTLARLRPHPQIDKVFFNWGLPSIPPWSFSSLRFLEISWSSCDKGGKFIFKKILRSLDKEQILGLNLEISRWGVELGGGRLSGRLARSLLVSQTEPMQRIRSLFYHTHFYLIVGHTFKKQGRLGRRILSQKF